MWCGVVWCGVVWCGVVWCGVVWCGVVWCGVVWCGVVWCGVVWCGVVWCGVVWCGVVWCGVVLCCSFFFLLCLCCVVSRCVALFFFLCSSLFCFFVFCCVVSRCVVFFGCVNPCFIFFCCVVLCFSFSFSFSFPFLFWGAIPVFLSFSYSFLQGRQEWHREGNAIRPRSPYKLTGYWKHTTECHSVDSDTVDERHAPIPTPEVLPEDSSGKIISFVESSNTQSFTSTSRTDTWTDTNPWDVPRTEVLANATVDNFVKKMYLGRARAALICKLLHALNFLFLISAVVQMCCFIVQVSVHGWTGASDVVGSTTQAVHQGSTLAFTIINMLLCAMFVFRSHIAISSLDVDHPRAKMFVHKVFDVVCSRVAWILFWNMVLFAQALRLVLEHGFASSWGFFWATVALIVLPVVEIGLFIFHSTEVVGTTLLSAPLVAFGSLVLNIYMAVVSVYFEDDVSGWVVYLTLRGVQVVFMASLIWSWKRVATPLLLYFKSVHFEPLDVEDVVLPHAPTYSRINWNRELAAVTVVKSIARGIIGEALGLLDGFFLQGIVYFGLLLLAYFVAMCDSGHCGTGTTLTIVGWALIPTFCVLAASVSLYVTRRMRQSNIAIINKCFALLCPGIYSFKFVQFLATCADQAYLVSRHRFHDLHDWAAENGLEDFQMFLNDKTSSEAWIATHTAMVHHRRTRIVVIAFAGTTSITDVSVDLALWQTPWESGPVDRKLRPRVHSGFARQWSGVKEPILKTFASLKEFDQVYIIGHSLGGGVGVLCAAELKQSGRLPRNVPLTVMTFGTPKIGNLGFERLYDRLVRFSFHFENLGDPIPKGPSVNYWPVGHRIPLANDKLLSFKRRVMDTVGQTCNACAKPLQHPQPEYLRRLKVAENMALVPQWAQFASTGNTFSSLHILEVASEAAHRIERRVSVSHPPIVHCGLIWRGTMHSIQAEQGIASHFCT